MSVMFRAVDVPVAAREEYWQRVIRDHMCPMDVRLDHEPGTEDELVVGDLGPVRVAVASTGPGEARRCSRHVRRADADGFQLFVQVRGWATGEQNGRCADLAPGDMSLVDLARPLRCVHPARRSIVLTFPRPMLPFRGSELEPLVGARIPGDTGPAALTSTLVRQLPRHLDEDAAVGARLGVAVVDLLAVALAARIERAASLPADARARALLVRIHAYIEGRLSDPELTPAAVAAAHHISLRYLHRLFEHQQRSVAGVIRQRRLDRCRADLTDPATAGRPVAAIAARWGFGNAAHFNRIFRDTYGMPPGEYRHRFTSASA